MRGQSRKVVGIVIHVVAVARLSGPAVASSVMGDDAIALFEEEQHLRIPVIGRQRPTMAEHDGLTFAPVLVVNLRSVFCCNCAHELISVLVVRFTNCDERLVARSTGWPPDIRRIYSHCLRTSTASSFRRSRS